MRFFRRLARGRSEATPARALTLVATVVWGVVAVVAVAVLLIYLFV